MRVERLSEAVELQSSATEIRAYSTGLGKSRTFIRGC